MINTKKPQTYMVATFSRLTNINNIWNLIGKQFIYDDSISPINGFYLTKALMKFKCFELILVIVKNTPDYKLSKDYNPRAWDLQYKTLPSKISKFVNHSTKFLFTKIEFEEFFHNHQDW
jgi:hypothetical protein